MKERQHCRMCGQPKPEQRKAPIAHCPSEEESMGVIDQIGRAQARASQPSPKGSYYKHLAEQDRKQGKKTYLAAEGPGEYPPDTTYRGWEDEPATDDHLVE